MSPLADRLRRFARDESGAISVLMVFLIPAFLVIFAIGLELTRLNTQRRYVQAQADLSALSAARRLPEKAEAKVVGKAVAQKNTVFGVIDVSDDDVQLGQFSRDTGFTAETPSTPQVDSVSVRLMSQFRPVLLKAYFGNEPLFITRRAVVARQDLASLTLRNALVRQSSADSALLRGLLGSQLGLNLALVSWEGLATTQISLTRLASLISAQTGAQLLTFQDVLNAQIGTGALMNGLVAEGLLPAAAVSAAPSTLVRLADILDVSPEVAALALSGTLPDLGVSVQGLLTSLAQLSGQKTHHLVNVAAGVTAPPLAAPTLSLQVVDPGAAAIGPVSYAAPLTAEAAQVVVTATGDVAGLVRLRLQVQAARATAKLSAINCRASNPNDIVATVEVETQPLTLALQVLLLEKPDGKTYSDARSVPIGGQVHQVAIRRSDIGKVVLVPNTFALSAVSSALTASLGVVQQDLNTEKNRLGLLGFLVAALLSVVNGLLNSVTSLLANTALLDTALQSLLDLLGIRVAQAELVLNGFDCRMGLVR